MDATEFCYWLQGYFEISNNTTLSDKEIKIIRDHLQLVFKKVTPTYPYYNLFKDVKPMDYLPVVC